MKGNPVRYWIVLIICLVAIYGSFVAARQFRSTAVVGPPLPVSSGTAGQKREPLKQFTLTDQNGQPFDSDGLRGKVWVASFFFTNCPGVCLQLNRTLAAIQETDPHPDVRFVSITCDPENDTPEALAKYAEYFKADPARWTFLTGDMQTIRRIGQGFFQISVDKAVHTDRACVVDRKGQVRGRFRLTEEGQVALLKRLLATVEAEGDDTSEHDRTAGEGSADAPADEAKAEADEAKPN
jgi:cytochrome oxidase Cu insertion factor (SCO1/SenC/PrrC family)